MSSSTQKTVAQSHGMDSKRDVKSGAEPPDPIECIRQVLGIALAAAEDRQIWLTPDQAQSALSALEEIQEGLTVEAIRDEVVRLRRWIDRQLEAETERNGAGVDQQGNEYHPSTAFEIVKCVLEAEPTSVSPVERRLALKALEGLARMASGEAEFCTYCLGGRVP